jgi:hypothetical protein
MVNALLSASMSYAGHYRCRGVTIITTNTKYPWEG